MPKLSVSVFFPCYNDEHTITSLVKTTDRILKKDKRKYEIIVVDDGSTDGSRKVLKKLQLKVSSLRLVFHKKNRGYGGALRSGFKHAKNDLVFYTDGDGQYDVNELKLLLPLLTEDIDVVNGIKMDRQDAWYRIILGKGYNFFVRNMFNINISDVDCDFRLIRRNKLRSITLKTNSGAICVELVKKLQNHGARFREVTVSHYDRQHGTSQFFRPRRIIATVVDLVKLWPTVVHHK